MSQASPRRLTLWAVIGLVAFLLLGLGATWRPAIGAISPPAPSSFSPGAVQRGAALAAVGDCAVCHTAAGGAAYAGGSAVATPFGVVYATNISPEPATGIGAWSLGAFRRAMRDGVDRQGARLYPALPYDHFTELTDADLGDLYAFLMSRAPARARAPANRLIPPLGFRPLLAGWDWLFLRHRQVAAEPGESADWNRGRYLAEALGHCGACHTPRNALGAEERDRAYAGGWSEGWFAPPLNRTSPAVAPWTADALYTYLRTGLSPTHAAAAGPMGPVTGELAAAPQADVRAIAVYFASQMNTGLTPRTAAPIGAMATGAVARGAILFAGACASCHAAGAGMMAQGRPALALGTPLHETNPTDTIQIILRGLQPPVGRSGPFMPPFAADFSDAQVADLIAYLHARDGGGPPWPADLAAAVAKARKTSGG